MKLCAADGTAFELTILGYQFPELASEQYDSNWLVIRIHVDHPSGSWEARDPCLLSYEVAELADWLEAVAQGEPARREMSFMEPNLEFRLHPHCASTSSWSAGRRGPQLNARG